MKIFPLSAVLFSLLYVSTAFAKVEIVLGDIPLNQNPNILKSIPETNDDLHEIIISKKEYVISYNRENRVPNWTSWKIDKTDLGSTARTNVFLIDKTLDNYLAKYGERAVVPTDYYDSCYDRGHQVPSADRKDSVESNQATFVMSNMLPQTAYLNRVVWSHLETYTRNLVINQGKKVFVIAGPIFEEDFGNIGPENNIRVPSKNFKIIYILNADQNINDINLKTPNISVIMPNILKSGKKPIEDRAELCASSTHGLQETIKADWEKYQVTIAEIEKQTGFVLQKN